MHAKHLQHCRCPLPRLNSNPPGQLHILAPFFAPFGCGRLSRARVNPRLTRALLSRAAPCWLQGRRRAAGDQAAQAAPAPAAAPPRRVHLPHRAAPRRAASAAARRSRSGACAPSTWCPAQLCAAEGWGRDEGRGGHTSTPPPQARTQLGRRAAVGAHAPRPALASGRTPPFAAAALRGLVQRSHTAWQHVSLQTSSLPHGCTSAAGALPATAQRAARRRAQSWGRTRGRARARCGCAAAAVAGAGATRCARLGEAAAAATAGAGSPGAHFNRRKPSLLSPPRPRAAAPLGAPPHPRPYRWPPPRAAAPCHRCHQVVGHQAGGGAKFQHRVGALQHARRCHRDHRGPLRAGTRSTLKRRWRITAT